MKLDTPNAVMIYFLLKDQIIQTSFNLHSSNDGILIFIHQQYKSIHIILLLRFIAAIKNNQIFILNVLLMQSNMIFQVIIHHILQDLMDIININVGQCGRRIGDNIMHRIYNEHFSEQQPIGKYTTFFSQGKNQYYARSIFVDFDIKQNEEKLIKNTSFYKQSSILRRAQSSQSIYGIPMFQCNNFKNEIQQQVRKQFEISQSVSGIILTSSYSGGAGSGLTSSIQQLLRQTHPDKMLQTFRLMPQFQLYAHPIQVYNTVFSIHQQVQQVDMSMMFDNGMLHKSLLQENNFAPTFGHLNDKIGQIIADSTIPFRFKGQLNTCQRKIASNLIPFPRMHFFTFSRSEKDSKNPLLSSLSLQNFSITNYFRNSSNTFQSRLFTVYAGIRSNSLCERDISTTVKKQFESKNIQFEQWIKDNVHISLHEPIKGKESVSVFVSGRYFFSYMRRISEHFTASFRRKAFIHRYLQAGMDEMQFTQADSNISDLYYEYQPHWSCQDQEWMDEQQNIQ